MPETMEGRKRQVNKAEAGVMKLADNECETSSYEQIECGH
jgi:hypothetical protein